MSVYKHLLCCRVPPLDLLSCNIFIFDFYYTSQYKKIKLQKLAVLTLYNRFSKILYYSNAVVMTEN